jgi:hypothetical protein
MIGIAPLSASDTPLMLWALPKVTGLTRILRVGWCVVATASIWNSVINIGAIAGGSSCSNRF